MTYTEDAEGIRAALAAADSAVSRLAAAADLEVANLTAEVERLTHELEAGKPVAPFGWSLGPKTPDAIGRPPWVRTYLQTGEQPTSWNADAGLTRAVGQATVGVWLSIKAPIGAWVVQLVDSIRAMGLRVVVTYRHEPQNDTPQDVTGYQQGWRALVDYLSVYPRPDVRTATIAMASKPVATWGQFDVAACDLWGVDRYNPGIANATRYVDPVDLFAPLVSYAAAQGKPLAVGETGSPVIGGDTAGRAAWAAKLGDYLDEQGCAVRCWWSSGVIALDTSTAQAWA